MVKYLIIGSGGMVGVKFLGTLAYLQSKRTLDDLEEISSASIGSMLGLLYIFFKGDLEQIIKTVFDFDAKEITKPNIKNLIYKFGLVDPKSIRNKLLEILGSDLTFKELYELWPIKLYISSYELLSDKTIYMSVDKNPDLSVITAVMRSISIPFVFVPETTETQLFMDGSCSEGNPYEPFLKYSYEQVIEIRVDENISTIERPKTLFGYITIIMSRLIRNGRVCFDNFKRINIQYDVNEILNFNATHEEKLKMYADGYSMASTQLE